MGGRKKGRGIGESKRSSLFPFALSPSSPPSSSLLLSPSPSLFACDQIFKRPILLITVVSHFHAIKICFTCDCAGQDRIIRSGAFHKLQHIIHHSKKPQFYSLFKHDYKISSYLDLIRNSANRKDLVKVRISNHKLMIKTGRYNQTSRNDRFCPICNSGIIEDEFHFLFHCPKYSIPREKFYNHIQQNVVDFNQLSFTELMIKFMNSQNFSVNSHFLKLCDDLRTNLLSNHADDT